MNDDSSPSDDALLESLVEELTARARSGERPDLDELASRYPHLADRIRELVPALFAMERAAAPSGSNSLHVPKRLGDYRILHFLGGGSMGMVYEAVRESRGPSPDRRYAIKILLPGRTRRDLERFRQEATATDRLRHPNIVAIHGIHESDGLNYLAMDLISGEGLNRILNDLRAMRDFAGATPSSPVAPDSFFGIPETGGREPDQPRVADRLASIDHHRAFARIAIQIADGLAHAHRNGVIHRDVKPSNILVDSNLKAWIADFGLAKLDRADNLTRRGEVVGTLRYIAPERFRGISRPACDIYSLGATLYEMLTLRPAFPQENVPELQHAVVYLTPPRPRVIEPAIPRDLETVVLKAIAREPAKRYATMAAFRDDLQRVLDGHAPRAQRPALRGQFLRASSVMGAIAIGGSILATAIFARHNWRLASAVHVADSRTRAAQEELLNSLLEQCRERPFGRMPGRRFETLELADRAERLAREIGHRDRPDVDRSLRDGRDAAQAAADLQAVPAGRRVTPGTKWFECDPDSGAFGRIDANGVLEFIMPGQDEPRRPPVDGPYVEFRFLTAGHRIIARTATNELRFLETSNRAVPAATAIADVRDWHLRPDTLRVVALHSDGSVACYRSSDGAIESRIPTPRQIDRVDRNRVLALHPERPLVVVGSDGDGSAAKVLDLVSGATIAVLANSERMTAGAWHPDGLGIFIAGRGANKDDAVSFIHRYDAGEQFRLAHSWPVHRDIVDLSVHPFTSTLVARNRNGQVTIYNSKNGHIQVETQSHSEGARIRWSKTGHRMGGFIKDGEFHLWNFEAGLENR